MRERGAEPSAERSSGAPARPRRRGRRWALALGLLHLLGIGSSVDALMSTRTPQGAIAWIVSLNTLPAVAVPAYWVFGRSRFQGYVTVRRQLRESLDPAIRNALERVRPYVVDVGQGTGHDSSAGRAGEALADLPYLRGNRVDLLVDGRATFDSLFAGIDAARDYVLVQFYIVRDDGLGRELAARLRARAAAGVRVWFLYDEIGSLGLPGSYVRGLEEAGCRVSPFHSTRGSGNRLQLNFRNHRKIVVVDGRVAWVGGHNVGDEYVDADPARPHWRDTHVRVEGPAALALQLSFLEDWRWATDEVLDLPWEPRAPAGADATVLVLPSGPADRLETASLMFQQAIHTAEERLWIASPYFVPDQAILASLHLAALRGVDVKVIVPDEPDSRLVYYSGYAFFEDLLASGIEVHRYEPGFLHEKVFLVDDGLAAVGTANLDNRSCRLNFEVTALVAERTFVDAVAAMLEDDLAASREMTLDEVREKPWWFRALSRASYLAAPVQ